ncbi:hypothetical protein J116_010175 [Streptomyces thermolilacinus SPC6]|uniref:Uncharacterized protein n=1 Tax=Streptomyces thermolilacinus SPC6 TaxID=1306406 RepID=A0A1D3DR31_9ACTN|nr:hypothetical protein J116_010175 [Streptomyces thermolilacinus SPC6]
MIGLLSSAPGRTEVFPAARTHQDVVRELDRAGRPWQPDVSLTFGSRCALVAPAGGASFVFDGARGPEAVLNAVGLPGGFHDCRAAGRGARP